MTKGRPANPGSPALVAVLGMHRAGTSLLANVLSEITGATEEHLLPGNEYNARGYWEDAEIVAIHNDVLKKIQREWGSVRASFPYPSRWWDLDLLAPERAQLKITVAKRTAAAAARGQPWIVKDPRLSRLFPLWKPLLSDLEISARAVLALRRPGAVAESLAQRDKFPPSLSEALWLTHYVDAVLDAGPHIRVVVHYDDWFSDSKSTISRIVSCLGLTGSGDNNAESVAAAVIEPGLRHHAHNTSSATLLDDFFNELQAWPTGGEAPASLVDMASNIRTTLEAFKAWQLAGEDDLYLDDARRMEAERQEEAKKRQLEHADRLLAQSKAALQQEHNEHQRAAKLVEMRDIQIEALEAGKSEAERTASELHAELTEAHEAARLHRTQIAGLEENVSRLEGELADTKRLLNLYEGRETPLPAKLARVWRGHFRRD